MFSNRIIFQFGSRELNTIEAYWKFSYLHIFIPLVYKIVNCRIYYKKNLLLISLINSEDLKKRLGMKN